MLNPVIDFERFSLPSKNGLQCSKEKGWEWQGRVGSCCQFHFLEMSVKCTGRKQKLEHFAAGGGGGNTVIYRPRHRIRILPVFPGVLAAPWHGSTHAPKLNQHFPSAQGGRGGILMSDLFGHPPHVQGHCGCFIKDLRDAAQKM